MIDDRLFKKFQVMNDKIDEEVLNRKTINS